MTIFDVILVVLTKSDILGWIMRPVVVDPEKKVLLVEKMVITVLSGVNKSEEKPL